MMDDFSKNIDTMQAETKIMAKIKLYTAHRFKVIIFTLKTFHHRILCFDFF